MTSLMRADGIRVEAGGRTILDVPSLEVRSGETLVLLGPTGAGKTTLLRVLGFLLRPHPCALPLATKVISREGIHEVA